MSSSLFLKHHTLLKKRGGCFSKNPQNHRKVVFIVFTLKLVVNNASIHSFSLISALFRFYEMLNFFKWGFQCWITKFCASVYQNVSTCFLYHFTHHILSVKNFCVDPKRFQGICRGWICIQSFRTNIFIWHWIWSLYCLYIFKNMGPWGTFSSH